VSEPDLAVVLRHLDALDRFVAQLRTHAGRDRLTLAGLDEAWAVERGLQLCAQNAIDVAVHLASRLGREPGDYTAAFDHLAEAGVLGADFARRFRGVAGFRNVLVHGYLDLDREVVFTAVNEGLDDFTEFSRQVRSWAASRASNPAG